jgi:rubrerythrin
MSQTVQQTRLNLEAALAGESMAHIKYRYFAKLCRQAGDEATAKVFEATAEQEVVHAWGHLELLLGEQKLTPAQCLKLAIEGETHEFTEMYPQFRAQAEADGDHHAVAEIDEQIAESKEHADAFAAHLNRAIIQKAEKRFAALARIEQRHAGHYQAALNTVEAHNG